MSGKLEATMVHSASNLGTGPLDAYWQDGYLFPIQVFSEREAHCYRRELEEIEANWL